MNLLAEENVKVNKVLSTLKQLRLGVIDYERTIYKSIRQKLNDDNIPFYTEYSLGKRKRIDFYVPGGIGIEVKKGKPNRQSRKFLVRANMARAGMQYYNSSWRHAGPVLGAKSKQRAVGAWNDLPTIIGIAAKRLKDAEIENVNAFDLIKKYNHKECLIYVDPPYLLSLRRQRYYNEEMTEDEEHSKLISLLKMHRGYVMISGYASELYDNELTEWDSIEIETQAEQGKKRIEKIWCNFRINHQVKFEI